MTCATITIDDPHGTITITRVRVAGYTRRDGRKVKAYWRTPARRKVVEWDEAILV